MKVDYKNMPTPDLVDLLAQKTQKFTQLMTDKNFNEEYKEYKEIIQAVVTEMEFRKGTVSLNPEKQDTL